MLFEAVFAIGAIGSTVDAKQKFIDGVFFSSIAILWFVILFLGIFELKTEKKMDNYSDIWHKDIDIPVHYWTFGHDRNRNHRMGSYFNDNLHNSTNFHL